MRREKKGRKAIGRKRKERIKKQKKTKELR
jgi:hypothetical protein